MAPQTTDPFGPAAVFRTTLWNTVLAAGSDNSKEAVAALEELCGRYWYPLYAFVRRRGHAHADAADITQSFFEGIIEKRTLSRVTREGGRFRSFLLTSLQNFLVNGWRNANRLRRGGGKQIVSLDDSAAETLYAAELQTSAPEQLFDRRSALSIIEQTLADLRAEFVRTEREDLFDALKIYLGAEKQNQSYAEIGAALRLSEDTIKTTVHRLRRRFGRLVRARVAETVRNPADVEDELRHLIAALASP